MDSKAHRANALGRAAAALTLVAMLGVLAIGISQCKLAPDQALKGNAFELSAGRGLGPCIRACAHGANDLLHEESALHTANVHACAGDADCLTREEARHQAAVARIQAGRDSCFARCHHQGRGGGR